MGTRGRPPKPTALKLLHGDEKKNPQRINRSEPIPADDVDLTVPPEYMSEAAKEQWRAIAPDRIRQGVLTPWDTQAFAAFCEALVLLRNAHEGALELAKPGQESPMSKFRQTVAICATLGGKFGWTPSDRARLMVGGKTREPGADLLSG